MAATTPSQLLERRVDSNGVGQTLLKDVYLGAFPVKNVTTAQYIPLDVVLPNTKTSQGYDFYIRNNGGQTISAGWDLYVTPKTYGPHA